MSLTCPFCEKQTDAFHKNSHIVPEWLYKLTFGKRYREYFVNSKSNTIELAQSGMKTEFICQKCEQLFSRDDKYGSLVLGKKNRESTVPNIAKAERGIVHMADGPRASLFLSGLDFKKLQNFVLGIILRGHMAKISGNSPFLGDRHFAAMRNLYKDPSRIDDELYPVFINKIDPRDRSGELLFLPYRGRKKQGFNFTGFLAGGFEFTIVVQSHPMPSTFSDIRLKKDGSIAIPVVQSSIRSNAQQAVIMTRNLAKKRWPGLRPPL